MMPPFPNSETRRGRVQGDGGDIAPTLTSSSSQSICINGEEEGYRRLTPRECFRLMGVMDEDIDKLINSGLSDSQLYKLAGNSIVVDVLEGIFTNLIKGCDKPSDYLF